MRIFLAHTSPKNKILEYNLSSAGCNFTFNLLSGNMFDVVYSILPPYVKANKNDLVEEGIKFVYLPSIRNSILRRLSPLVEQWMLFKKIPRTSSLWLYNVTTLNALLIFLLWIFKPSVKCYVIVLDYIPGARYNNFFLRIINKCDGLICLANSERFSKKNTKFLPGVTPATFVSRKKITHVTKDFLLCGTLRDEISMLSRLLPAFSQMPHLNLHITGELQDTSLLEKYKGYSNIHYHGILPYDEFLQLSQDIPFLLSTRNPESSENQCNFPSKVIEALLNNRIIISTIAYEQLEGINYFTIGTERDEIIADLLHISSLPEEQLLRYANQDVIVCRLFNPDRWRQCVEDIERKAGL